MIGKSVLAFVLAVTVTGIVMGQQSTYQSDEAREQKLRADLEHLHIVDLEADVRGGMATLSGTAESLFQKRQASVVAKEIPGVEEVFNDLGVVKVEDSAALEQAILDELKKDRHYTMYDLLELTVHDGAVTLTGRLAPGGSPEEIEKTVSKVRGVRSIENNIRLLPYSESDERLREAIAAAVLDALGGERLAGTDLHVVVENGHVTLAGIVRDDQESSLVETAARQTKGALSVANLLEVEQPSTASMRLP